ncbi:MAG TPA: hypothetical protein VF268_00385 [Gammaproteobacteria bacterium]
MKDKLRTIIGSALIIVLTACGSGGGGGNNEIDGNNDIDASANGLWHGYLTHNGIDHYRIAIIQDGRIMLINPNFGSAFDGSYTIEGETISANLIHYSDVGLSFGGTLSGEVAEEYVISALLEYSSGLQAPVQLTFLEEYHRDSSLSLLEGVWDNAHITNPITTDLTIGAEGSFSGMDDNLCVIKGDIGIIDDSINLYDVDIIIGGCIGADEYTGFARLIFDPHEMLEIVAFGDSTMSMVYYNKLSLNEVSNGGALFHDVPVAGLSGTVDSRIYYTFTISEEDLMVAGPDPEFRIAISGGTGDVDLYVRFEDIPPVVTPFRCMRLENDPGNDENCVLNVKKAGTFHVMLHADVDDYSGVSLTASLN